MKSTLVVICLFFSAFCIGQTNPANPTPENPSSGGQTGPRNGHRPPGVVGTISAIDGNTLTVKTQDGRSASVTLNDKTQYRKDREPAKLSDLKVGDSVFVRGEQNADNSWQAEMVGTRTGGGSPDNFRGGMGKGFIAGEIKSIDGTQLTIQRQDGTTQTISVDENTSFRKAGESVTLADFRPGDHVYGRGELKNGVFVPMVLNFGEPSSGMRRENAPPEPR
jgi:preprotein translocase subunit YajC